MKSPQRSEDQVVKDTTMETAPQKQEDTAVEKRGVEQWKEAYQT